ncbi:MAG: trypsin-like peptidase domain-containing protein [Chloroflexi bacterium]|nr:trypsin-like peptidase domain-containing protein [Chloroflexota bacterium]
MTTLLQQLNAQMSNVIEQGWRSLVRVGNGEGAGAGTIWHPDGLIVTNAHVAAQRTRRGWRRPVASDELKVTLADGRDFMAQVIAFDEQNDLAALAIETRDLPTIALGNSWDVRTGQWVMALGHPWGVHGAATSGIVIGKGTNLPEMPAGRDWIALSLHLRPGHSGGPLLDTNGQLIGINTMITGPDVGFAIPVDTVKSFLRQALGTRGAI